MSISDFTLTSPRKSALKNRSITYDEEFEKFLNDTSESDASMTKYMKHSTEKPWWLKEDEDEEEEVKVTKNDTKKSFIKQKPPPQSSSPTKLYASTIKLTTTIEDDDEINDAKNDNEKSKDIDMPKLSIDNSSYSMNHFEENKHSRSYSENDENHSENQKDIDDEENLNESTTDNPLSSPESKPSVVDRFKPTITPRSHEDEKRENKKPPQPESSTLKTLITTNLLSKVMFMDSLTSGEAANTLLKTNTDKLNVTVPQRQTQTSEIKPTNSNNDTQTKRDLDDLERVYRNLTTFTDSGLNSLIRTNQPSADHSLERPNRSYDNARELNQSNNSEIGLQAVHAITTELENRALDQILKEIEKNSKTKKNINFETSTAKSSIKESSSYWPPDKYKHIKSTGYGTSWSPTSYIGHLNKETNKLPVEHESRPRTQPKSVLKQSTQVIERRSPSNNSNESKIIKDNQIYIQSLKNQMVKRESDHEKLIRELRLEYEQQINELKSRIDILKSKIEPSANQSDEIDSSEIKSKKDELEKLKEQDNLIKGYQQENERLYSDLKRLKEKNKLEVQNLNEQISNLKFNLIQEKINFENQSKLEDNNKSISNLNAITSTDLENQLNQVQEVNRKYEQIVNKLNEKLSYYEKNQQQIELDMKLIEAKNNEIKKLNNKLKKLEMGKTPVDCLKEIKNLKNQIREMDGLIKRLKQPVSTTQSNEVNMSINFYELKIKELEEELKEKELSLNRLNRFWEQKFHLYQQTLKRSLSQSPNRSFLKSPTRDVLDKKLTEFEKNYVEKIEHLENLTQNLRKIISEFETRVIEKDNELNRVRLDKDNQIESLKKQLESSKIVKVYEPKEFIPLVDSPRKSANFDLINEIESLKLKLANAQNEVKISNREFNLELKQIKILYENKLEDMLKKHKQEIEKLVQVFTGTTINSDYMSNEFPFSDPIQMRLLLNARDKHSEMTKTIEKQKLLLKKLNQHINEQNVYRDKCFQLEDENRRLKEQLDDLKLEESFLKSINTTSDANAQVKQYEFLKEKIKKLESNLRKREKELKAVLNQDESSTNESVSNVKLNELKRFYEHQLEMKNKEINKFRLEFDSMIQLLHSL